MLYLFDLDGTLMNSAGSGRRAFARACEAVLGIPRALDGVVLDTDPRILAEACLRARARPPSPGEARAVIEAYLQLLADELRAVAVEVLPSVRETLDALHARGALTGLATGNVEAGARLKLEAAALWDRFPFGGFGSDAAERADLVWVAIARAERHAGRRFARAEIALIGDTPRDVAAARAVGVRAVGVATGSHRADALAAAGADEVHETLATFAG